MDSSCLARCRYSNISRDGLISHVPLMQSPAETSCRIQDLHCFARKIPPFQGCLADTLHYLHTTYLKNRQFNKRRSYYSHNSAMSRNQAHHTKQTNNQSTSSPDSHGSTISPCPPIPSVTILLPERYSRPVPQAQWPQPLPFPSSQPTARISESRTRYTTSTTCTPIYPRIYPPSLSPLLAPKQSIWNTFLEIPTFDLYP